MNIELPKDAYDDIPDEEMQKRDVLKVHYDEDADDITPNAFELRNYLNPPEYYISLTRMINSNSSSSESLLKYSENKIKRFKAFCLLKSNDIRNIKIEGLSSLLLRQGLVEDNHSGIFTYDDSGLVNASTTNPQIGRLQMELWKLAKNNVFFYSEEDLNDAIEKKKKILGKHHN